MSLNEYLLDLIQDLDSDELALPYSSFRLTHNNGCVCLDDLGTAGYEHFANITAEMVLSEPVAWRFHRLQPDGRLIELSLTVGDDIDIPEVRVEAGAKGDELVISDIIGKLKEMYP